MCKATALLQHQPHVDLSQHFSSNWTATH